MVLDLSQDLKLSNRLLSSAGIVLALLLGCREKAPPERSAIPHNHAPAPAKPTRARRPRPDADFDCQELRAPPKTEGAPLAEAIELRPPTTGKKLVLSKTGVVVTFSRDDFSKAARCLELEQAIRYVETETGHLQESPMRDAAQVSYTAAALLDAGRAGVRRSEETDSRTSIVRDGWAADGCAGRCRSFGRLYRLSEDDPSFFLRVTDQTRNHWNQQP